MKFRMAILAATSLVALLISGLAPLHGQQAPNAQEHEQHPLDTAEPPAQTAAGKQPDMARMMAMMRANDQKLDALVKKMNAAQGTAKVDAMAELLMALVHDRRTMHESIMSNMSTMMDKKGTMHDRGEAR
jgi:hypothetical protein